MKVYIVLEYDKHDRAKVHSVYNNEITAIQAAMNLELYDGEHLFIGERTFHVIKKTLHSKLHKLIQR